MHNRPGLLRNLLCGSDWLQPARGISETECLISPNRELAAIPAVQYTCERLETSSASQLQKQLERSSTHCAAVDCQSHSTVRQ